ncbi:MAG: MipA/OmpV family protein [Oligoflexales bacterium]
MPLHRWKWAKHGSLLTLVLVGTMLKGPLAFADTTDDRIDKEQKPLYELGIGAGSGYFLHYPASDQGKWRSVVVPTVLYRGSIFRADEEDGLRARLVSHPSYGVEISGAGTLPIPSDENSARQGMPDLDLLGEVGPQLYIKIQKDEDLEARLLFPLRFASSTDFSSVHPRGFTFTPGFQVRAPLQNSLGTISFTVSPTFGSSQYQEYFYGVADRYATPNRPAYRASAGYIGTRTEIGFFTEWHRVSFYAQVDYNNYQKAKNAKSPLFKADHAVSGFFGISWLLYQSEAKEDDRE